MDSLLEAWDRFAEWHGTLAPWVHVAESAVLGVPFTVAVWAAFCLFAA